MFFKLVQAEQEGASTQLWLAVAIGSKYSKLPHVFFLLQIFLLLKVVFKIKIEQGEDQIRPI